MPAHRAPNPVSESDPFRPLWVTGTAPSLVGRGTRADPFGGLSLLSSSPLGLTAHCPIWLITIIGFDVFTIWALTVHERDITLL